MNKAADRRLNALRGTDLDDLHRAGVCPAPGELAGTMDGAVLTGSLALVGVRSLGIWRGKIFDEQAGEVSGINRLGIGPVEVRRYRFTARRATSLFSDREVLCLDHDSPENPDRIRRFHDELVRIEPGLYLATSHCRYGQELRLLAYFALAAPSS
ncbi:hypothetical protein KVF89_23375 [Nocardioides carbamazepini]|uniref:hypothetical protein n=1 Tax=Nocardioides carbamazepini TaxID=2854259 RepID=UPI00214A0D95|nr:hypothetical protein [Nocardioides carbamazepini]MCR1785499.1 hypothetical protein [Nocardioides carbamazepini]